MRARSSWSSLCSFLCTLVAAAPGSLHAQDAPDFAVRHFTPTPGPFGIFSTELTDVMDHLAFSVRAMADYAHRPLVTDDAAETAVVDGTATFNLTVAVGLLDLVEVGLVVPFILLHEGNYQGRALDDNSVGDLTLRGKVRLPWERDDLAGIGLAAGADLGIPVGAEEDFLGDGFLTFGPWIAADYLLGPALAVANLGITLREESTTQNIVSTHTLDYRLGARVDVVDHLLDLRGELFGALPLTSQAGEDYHRPLEWLLGARIQSEADLHFTVGAGSGLSAAAGSPELRVLLGVEYSPLDSDRDDDGLGNYDDACPDQPEDRDGFEDEDGCPDTDNDGDGVLDAVDACPVDAEDVDGVGDEDGCPDPDTDGDGVDDPADRCPAVAEDLDGFEDGDGCPDLDNDNDGIADADDACADQAEDVDTYQDSDGCPDPDNDGDGIPDVDDGCPFAAEDLDGFEDTDGCPDLDNDRDGVPDDADQCPTELEVINGVSDEDGCPDEGKTLVVVKAERLEILDRVFFAVGEATIDAQSFGLLDQVALTLLANPQLARVRVEGHTDDKGDADANMALSQARAESVVAYLVGRGVAAGRLEAVGYGPTRPLIDSTSTKARKANRRVEFVIVQ